jgi:hypothetical protein
MNRTICIVGFIVDLPGTKTKSFVRTGFVGTVFRRDERKTKHEKRNTNKHAYLCAHNEHRTYIAGYIGEKRSSHQSVIECHVVLADFCACFWHCFYHGTFAGLLADRRRHALHVFSVALGTISRYSGVGRLDFDDISHRVAPKKDGCQCHPLFCNELLDYCPLPMERPG